MKRALAGSTMPRGIEREAVMSNQALKPLPAQDRVPRHVAVIMDGNHRWARERRLPGAAGHRAGARAVRPVAEQAANLGIEVLTLFAFSTENWQRPKREVSLLIELMKRVLRDDVEELDKHEIRVRIIGDRSRFGDDIRDLMARAEALTADNRRMTLMIAANYGGRWDIANAARTLAERVASGELTPADVDEDALAAVISMADVPAPDLCIRTGGDRRISNFLLWQFAYTELYFTDTFWPDFDAGALDAAVEDFACRQRRFGRRVED
jgi:undecaprenyl diphosphate synthase